MKFKGYNFRVSKTIVMLKGYYSPTLKVAMENATAAGGAYVRFGKVCKESAKGAEATHYTYPNGQSVFALPIEIKGYSLTNMAYGKDGKVYLAKDGGCYTAPQVNAAALRSLEEP